MLSLEERIAKTKEKTKRLEEAQRIAQRKEREIRRKKDARRNYIIGALVSQYYPDEISRFEPKRTNAENADEFEPLETFLSVLADETETLELLKAKTKRRLLLKCQR